MKAGLIVFAVILLTWWVFAGCVEPMPIERVMVVERATTSAPTTTRFSGNGPYYCETIKSSLDGKHYQVHVWLDADQVSVVRKLVGKAVVK